MDKELEQNEDLDFTKLNASHLDSILKESYNPTATLPKSFGEIKERFNNLTLVEVAIILDKLTNDDYVKTTYSFNRNKTTGEKIYNENDPYYNITFEGYYFLQNGGYTGQLNRNHSEMSRVRVLEKRTAGMQSKMFWLTVLLAVGTSIAAWYYLTELWKYYHHC